MWKAEQKSMAVFLIAQFININAFENCRKKTPFAEEDDEEEEAPVEEETLRAFALNLCRNATSTTFSIIASQPFYVIAVRTMAQFVGQEQKYTWVTFNRQLDFLIFDIYLCSSGVFASAKEIYQESGISGFFQGVTPRITGEVLALVLASSVGFTVSTYILGDPRSKSAIKMIAGVRTL